MKNVEFTCPKCGEIHLEEIMVDVTVTSMMSDLCIEDGFVNCRYIKQTNEDGIVDHYRCENCSYVLTINGDIVNDLEGLARWFVENEQIGY